MDFSEQDEMDLRELFEQYRSGYGVSHLVEILSARWAEQGRDCYGIGHKAKQDIPLPQSRQRLFGQLMSELRDN